MDLPASRFGPALSVDVLMANPDNLAKIEREMGRKTSEALSKGSKELVKELKEERVVQLAAAHVGNPLGALAAAVVVLTPAAMEVANGVEQDIWEFVVDGESMRPQWIAQIAANHGAAGPVQIVLADFLVVATKKASADAVASQMVERLINFYLQRMSLSRDMLIAAATEVVRVKTQQQLEDVHTTATFKSRVMERVNDIEVVEGPSGEMKRKLHMLNEFLGAQTGKLPEQVRAKAGDPQELARNWHAEQTNLHAVAVAAGNAALAGTHTAQAFTNTVMKELEAARYAAKAVKGTGVGSWPDPKVKNVGGIAETEGPGRVEGETRRCHNCNEVGHLMLACTQPRKKFPNKSKKGAKKEQGTKPLKPKVCATCTGAHYTGACPLQGVCLACTQEKLPADHRLADCTTDNGKAMRALAATDT